MSKVNQRFAEKLKKDKRLRRRVENIIDAMSYVKGSPLFLFVPDLEGSHWTGKLYEA